MTPGRCDQTLKIVARGTPETPVIIRLAPGRYDLHPTHAERRRYHISNNNDDPDTGKAIGLLIEDSRHVQVIGTGAQLVFHDKMIECCIDRSEDITVTGLTFDYHRPTVSEFTVTDTTAETADLEIHADSTYRVEDGRIVWPYATALAQELNPETDELRRRKDPLAGLTIEELAPFRVRAQGRHDMVKGRVYQLRDTRRDGVGVFIHQSRNVVFRDCDFRFTHGMGIVGQLSENITLDRVKIAPDPASGRTTACWADCTHFSGCRGKITVKDCVFNGAHDDAMNVHGTYLKIVAALNDREIRVKFMHRQTYGFPAFHAGDEIEFVRGETLATFGANRVTSVEMSDPREIVLKLESSIPVDWREGDVVENVTWTPEVEVTGCQVRRIPTRGFLITTRRKVVVAGNEFIGMRGGIHVEGDAGKWYESGCVRDMEIRNNQFVRVKGEAVCVRPPDSTVHRNIRIFDNRVIQDNE